MASEEQKIYPGSVERYRALREARLEAETKDETPELTVARQIAEELAGLAYILDGIRYAARKS